MISEIEHYRRIEDAESGPRVHIGGFYLNEERTILWRAVNNLMGVDILDTENYSPTFVDFSKMKFVGTEYHPGLLLNLKKFNVCT